MTFVSAWSPQPGRVIFQDDQGKQWVREGGSRSWRNFNPGNIQKGGFADACGAIGGDTRFAIFPDEETGLEAIVSLLKSKSYRDLTLSQAMYRYAPPGDHNNTEKYIQFIVSKTGVDRNSQLKSLTDQQLLAIAKAIQTEEGWKPGKEYEAGQGPAHAAEAFFAEMPAAEEMLFSSPRAEQYVYEQATGNTYVDYGGSYDFFASGYSGSADHGGKNNPDAQCEKDIGPLPRGIYQIGNPVTGPSPFSLPLKPAPENDMCGRSGFYIHGDSIAAPGRASHGCIIMKRPDRERMAASGLRKLKVVDRIG